jgi:phosphate transport system substrate-binding protein
MKWIVVFLIACVMQANAFSANYSTKDVAGQMAVEDILMIPQPMQNIYSNNAVITLFSMHGSNTLGESLTPNLAKRYLHDKGIKNVRIVSLAQSNEKVVTGDWLPQGKTVQIHIAAHGSSTGFKGIMSNDADIWASSRPVKTSEVERAHADADLRDGSSEHVVAIDGLAIVVHPQNPITQLNKAQLARVFSGDAKNWQEFGGKDQAIHLYARDENSGTWDSFKNMVLGKSSPLSPDAQRYESSEALVSKVVSDPGGIGFIGLAFVGASKLLAISDGQAAFKPSLLTVATEDYALSRRLFLYTKGESSNEYVREFIAFCQGVNGQEIVEKQGFISQNVAAMNTQLADDLPAEYLEIVQGNQRLSVNFRFQPGSAKLDNKASKDIQRLVYFIKQQKQPKEIILIGFGDRRKNAQRSKLLSKLRAMAVRRELARLGVYAKLSTGYGEFNPLASYQSRSGKIKNRRVEVWLR